MSSSVVKMFTVAVLPIFVLCSIFHVKACVRYFCLDIMSSETVVDKKMFCRQFADNM